MPYTQGIWKDLMALSSEWTILLWHFLDDQTVIWASEQNVTRVREKEMKRINRHTGHRLRIFPFHFFFYSIIVVIAIPWYPTKERRCFVVVNNTLHSNNNLLVSINNYVKSEDATEKRKETSRQAKNVLIA